MTIVVSVLEQLVHIVLLGAAAPTFAGVARWIEARLTGRVGPSPFQPWRDLRRLLRKQTLLAANASWVSTHGPVAYAICISAAACLVPSFTLGMAFAPAADLLLIFGLLLAARVAMALLALDAGTAPGGIVASQSMLRCCLAEPSCVLVVFVLALLAGSMNVDVIAAMQSEQVILWRPGLGLVLATTALLGLAEVLPADLALPELGGRELALIETAGALRLLVWFNLLGALFLPLGMAQLDAGPIEWLLGLLAWLARSLLFAAMLALLRAYGGRLTQRRAMRAVGVALLLGVLAALFTLAGVGVA
jgi:formate hydrogenlyase subunit 4